jgi:hypothetical protein
MKWYTPIRPLYNWIWADKDNTTYNVGHAVKGADNCEESVGRMHGVGCKESQINYRVAGLLTDHERYPLSTKTFTVLLSPRARYHVNPTSCDIDDASLQVISDDKAYTRSAAAGISLLGNAAGDSKQWFVKDGILEVPLKVNNTGLLKKVASLTTVNGNDGVSVFATQISYVGERDTTVTSDYACLYEEKVSDLRLSHVKHNRQGALDTDYIETKLFNDHCGDCSLPSLQYVDENGNTMTQRSYNHKGMHLFGTVEEAKYYIESTNRIDNSAFKGEGMDLVDFHANINLNKLVETHYTNAAGTHDVFDPCELDKYFYYRFHLTSLKIGDNATNESAHACIIVDEDGTSWLHPYDPMVGGLLGRDPKGTSLTDWSNTTEVVVNRVPLVRVELVKRGQDDNLDNDSIVDYGYLPIRIVKDFVPTTELVLTFDHYPHAEETVDPWNVVRYGKCVYDLSSTRYETDWRKTEEDLLSLAHNEYPDKFSVLDRITFEKYYDPETDDDGYCIQYLVTGPSATKQYTYTPCGSTPSTMSVGEINYYEDSQDDGTHTSVFIWTVGAADIQTLASANIKTVRRAVKLVSSDKVNYPDIFVIFQSPTISLSDVKITGDAHLKEHIIKEYLYAKNEQTLGNDEIHTNVLTPEENSGNRLDIFYDYDGAGAMWDDLRRGAPGDRNKESAGAKADPANNAWKPAYMDNKFSDVFLGNLQIGNTPANWLTFTPETGTYVPSFFSSNIDNLDLDFVFDASNANYRPKGYIDNTGIAREFKLAVSSNGKVLYAYRNSLTIDPDTIAEILVDGSVDEVVTPNSLEQKWNNDNARLRRMRIDYKRQTKRGYAEALLNYKAHDALSDDVIKATVELKAWADLNNDGNKCELTLVNNTFDVRFLRPITIIPGSGTTITDANDEGDGSQVIKISDLAPMYSDWRDTEATRVLTPSWKGYLYTNYMNKLITAGLATEADIDPGRANPNYDQYYAQNGKNSIAFRLAYNFADSTSIANDPNVTTDLNGNTTPVSLKSVSEQLDFMYYDTPKTWTRNGVTATCVYLDTDGTPYDEPVLVYRNLSSTVGTFHVYLPVLVEYYWGNYYDKITITINKTRNNARRK